MRELTWPAVVLGLLLSVVMGAANVYLGLKAGMTVSASIPAAVISMGILHGIFRRRSLLESNQVQTAASAGESLAAGIIFTMPAMIMIGYWRTFEYWTTTLIALSGGILGILFMIPMRKVFIVDDKTLKYPEGVACAEVLKAGEGEEGAKGAKLVFGGVAVGAVFKFVASFLGLFKGTVEWATFVGSRIFVLGADISPALVGVGFIVGLGVSMHVFLGGVIGWVVSIPFFHVNPSEGTALEQAWSIWSKDVRYMGVGGMLVGGAASIWRVRSGLVSAVREISKQLRSKSSEGEVPETERNISGGAILLLGLFALLIVVGVYAHFFAGYPNRIPATALTTIIMVVMAFFFTAVASYIVGLVGNSNSPVSGMTITTVLVTGLLLSAYGMEGMEGMVAILGVAGIVCCVACTSGDVCNDLKTGYLIGASPRKQQIMEILGVFVAAFIMAPVLIAIHEGSLQAGTGGIGGRSLPAPQAGMFASLARAFFGEGLLPWNMVWWGVGIGSAILVIDAFLAASKARFRLHVMPLAVGIYLPIGVSVPIAIGGFLHYLITRGRQNEGEQRARFGVLASSGVIAGESIIGVVLAILAYFSVLGPSWSKGMSPQILELISLMALAAFCVWLYRKAKS